MEIFFNTKKLAKLCNNKKEVCKKLGNKNAKFLLQRLSQLSAVDRLGDFKFDRPHALKGNLKNQFAITVFQGVRLTFLAIEPNTDSNGNIIWNAVTKININYIGDYHE
jgi:plasmid maintenance system killer protein